MNLANNISNDGRRRNDAWVRVTNLISNIELTDIAMGRVDAISHVHDSSITDLVARVDSLEASSASTGLVTETTRRVDVLEEENRRLWSEIAVLRHELTTLREEVRGTNQ